MSFNGNMLKIYELLYTENVGFESMLLSDNITITIFIHAQNRLDSCLEFERFLSLVWGQVSKNYSRRLRRFGREISRSYVKIFVKR